MAIDRLSGILTPPITFVPHPIPEFFSPMRPKIAVCSFWFSGHQELADATTPNKEAYCELHGYDYWFECKEEWGPADKLRIMRMLLDDYDAALWIDCDAFFANPSFKIEALIDHTKCAVLTITRDGYDYAVNSGVFLMERWDETLQFLDWALQPEIFAQIQQYPLKDQDILAKFAVEYPELTRILPQRMMNSYLRAEYEVYNYPWSDYQPGDWILHAAGLPMEKRIAIAKKYA
jgi:hypothetical protein